MNINSRLAKIEGLIPKSEKQMTTREYKKLYPKKYQAWNKLYESLDKNEQRAFDERNLSFASIETLQKMKEILEMVDE